MVPISSPLAAFVMLPGMSMLNTIIGILLFIYGLAFIFVFNQGTFVILFLAVVLLLWTRVKSVPATRFFKFLLVLV